MAFKTSIYAGSKNFMHTATPQTAHRYPPNCTLLPPFFHTDTPLFCIDIFEEIHVIIHWKVNFFILLYPIIDKKRK